MASVNYPSFGDRRRAPRMRVNDRRSGGWEDANTMTITIQWWFRVGWWSSGFLHPGAPISRNLGLKLYSLQQAHSPSMDDRDDSLLFCTELSIIAMYDRGWSCEAYFLALFVNCAMSVMWFSPSCGDSGHLVDGIDGIVSAIEHSTFGIWNWVSHFWVWMCWERRRLSF